MVKRDADGDGVGNPRRRRGAAIRGNDGLRGQHRESPLRGLRGGRSMGPPWGKAGAKGEIRRQEGKKVRQNLGSEGRQRGPRGLRSGTGFPRSGGREGGGRKASGVAENPQGSRQGVGGGVESPQGTNTPGVTELPRGGETPGVTTAGEGAPREDGRGRGGYKTPPHHPSNRGARRRRRRQQVDGQAEDGGSAAPTSGHEGGRRQRRDPAKAYRWHRRR